MIFRLKPEEINQVSEGWREVVALHVRGWEWAGVEKRAELPLPLFFRINYIRIGCLEHSRVWKLQIPSKISQVLGYKCEEISWHSCEERFSEFSLRQRPFSDFILLWGVGQEGMTDFKVPYGYLPLATESLRLTLFPAAVLRGPFKSWFKVGLSFLKWFWG